MSLIGAVSLTTPKDGVYIGRVNVDNYNLEANQIAYSSDGINLEGLNLGDGLQKDIDALKEQTVAFIKEEVAKGKTVYGYGASTKGNTLLQYFGLDNTLVTAMVERSPYKFGLKTSK